MKPSFKIGEIVCLKPSYKSPYFLIETPIHTIQPLKITGIEPHGSDYPSYHTTNLVTHLNKEFFDYELMLWKDIKRAVIEANEDYVTLLSGI